MLLLLERGAYPGSGHRAWLCRCMFTNFSACSSDTGCLASCHVPPHVTQPALPLASCLHTCTGEACLSYAEPLFRQVRHALHLHRLWARMWALSSGAMRHTPRAMPPTPMQVTACSERHCRVCPCDSRCSCLLLCYGTNSPGILMALTAQASCLCTVHVSISGPLMAWTTGQPHLPLPACAWPCALASAGTWGSRLQSRRA